MNDHREWFAPKTYGYGAGLPVSWQGWLVFIFFLLVLIACGGGHRAAERARFRRDDDPADRRVHHDRQENHPRRLALALGR